MQRWIVLMVSMAGCTNDSHPLACGEGTMIDGDMCVGDVNDGVECGSGTHEEGGLCVPDVSESGATYELRAYSPVISADGRSKTPVLVIGTNPDGTPATDRVLLRTNRADAGRFLDQSPTLGSLGTTAQFVPCNATATPSCVGPATLTLALDNNPSHIVATLDVNLVVPDGVASTAPCMAADRAMYFDGNDYIYNGTLSVTEGDWSDLASTNWVRIHLLPSGQQNGLWWDFEFDTKGFVGTSLTPGVYEMAERAGFASPNHPGLDVSGDGRGCNTIAGRFQVHYFELLPGNQRVKRALISFEQYCSGSPNLLSGCVRYEP